jgi:sulfate adenylyltransferase subunit 2
MSHLDRLENFSIHILREAYSEFNNLCMLWSIGKDSTVLLWLARKAFFGHVPIPLIHIDTKFKIPEMIEFRDRLAREWKLDMIYGQNQTALETGTTFPQGKVTRLECCRLLKTEAFKNTVQGTWPRYRMNHESGQYEMDRNAEPFTGVILGIRADEEGSRSKERYFSARDHSSNWSLEDQPPEFWNQFKTDFAPGTHVRIHPLLDWRESDVWEYIGREKIPVVSLYFHQGNGQRYRSLGCAPCTAPVESEACTVEEIVAELKTGKFSRVAERAGRAQDREDCGGLEQLRREGYM